MDKKVYKLGIIGTGNIAHRFVPEARTVEGIEVVAAYNPRIASAEKFVEELNITYATDKIEKFLEKVDAVYIATPHETHVEYCRQMLAAGKHVLCEKPMSFVQKDAEELFALAKEKSLVLMEGIKTAYCPGFKALLETIESGKIGRVVDVEACFSRISSSNVREVWDTNYGGSFTEFGTYSLLPIVKLLGVNDQGTNTWTLPGKTGVDVYTKTSIDYGDATALAKTGLAVKSEGQLVIAGTKGYILVPSPWWLTKYFEVRYEDPNKIEKYNFAYEGQGLRYEIQEFIDRMNGSNEISLFARESIWIAKQMEAYRKQRTEEKLITTQEKSSDNKKVNIWAHRGCSLAYPENTLEAFEAAAKLKGITGIELDVQLTWDEEIVVIHDETVNRTTNRSGRVADYTLAELQSFEIESVNGTKTRIPTLREVFALLEPYCKEKGLLINIELKNSVNRYEGMEEKTLALVEEFHLEDHIVYSSFLPESMGLIRHLNPQAKTGTLASSMEKCLLDAKEQHADALHPWNGGMDLLDLTPYIGYPIRIWNGEEPFFGQNRVLKETNMTKYVKLGTTDIITNVPELYLNE